MIIVAIDNDDWGRMNEYAAWKFQESNIPGQQFGGKGVECRVVMEVVKPFIDENYHYRKYDRKHTAMIGSSHRWLVYPIYQLGYQSDWLLGSLFHLLTGFTRGL